VNRLKWYRSAARELGVSPLIRRQVQRRFGAPGGIYKLTAKTLSHPVFARRGTSDWAVFDQIFVEHQYRCLDGARIAKDGLIVDCGANVGYATAYFMSRYPTCVVVAVEPDQSNFIMLKRNICQYPQSGCIPILGAVWPHAQDTIALADGLPGEEWGRKVKRVDAPTGINTFRIPDLLLNGHTRIALLKIDIEGAEIELFKTGPERWLDIVDNIVIELHGSEAERVFHVAIAPFGFDVFRHGELTVCLHR
jgi:FkbM family methyltransferase